MLLVPIMASAASLSTRSSHYPTRACVKPTRFLNGLSWQRRGGPSTARLRNVFSVIKAKNDVGEDLSYNPKEMLALVQPPERDHNGFTNAIRTGNGKPRSAVHKDGDWHHSVHVWLYDSKEGTVLVQRRSQYKDTNPGKLDVSAAGHIEVGHDSLVTALREVEEEIGLTVTPEDLKFLHTAVSESSGSTANHGPYVCRELQDVFLVDFAKLKEMEPQEISVADGEVEEALWISIDTLHRALTDKDSDYVPRARTYVDGLVEAMVT